MIGRIALVGLVDGVLRLVQEIFGLIFPWVKSIGLEEVLARR